MLRCEGTGTSQAVRRFSTYCPKVFVAIDALRDTLADCSIMVAMERKGRDEQVDRILLRQIKAEATALRQRIVEVVAKRQKAIEIEFQKIDCPSLTDRDAENWSSLLAICQILCPKRMSELLVTAVRNSAEKQFEDEDENIGHLLLANIRDTVNLQVDNNDPKLGISSTDLLGMLRSIEAPWGASDEDLSPKISALLATVQVLRGHGELPGWEAAPRVHVLPPSLGRVPICPKYPPICPKPIG